MATQGKTDKGPDRNTGPKVVMEAYDFAKSLHEVVLRFPRVERPGLGADIERACREVLLRLVEAQTTPGAGKAGPLRAAALEIEKLRFLVRMACDFHLLSIGRYEAASATADRIGRMVGGWLRWVDRGSTQGREDS